MRPVSRGRQSIREYLVCFAGPTPFAGVKDMIRIVTKLSLADAMWSIDRILLFAILPAFVTTSRLAAATAPLDYPSDHRELILISFS